MKKFMMIAFLAVLACWIFADITYYELDEGTGTYEPLATYDVSTASGDDGTQLLTLPFSFTYNGVAYSSLGVCMNGFARLGVTSSAWTNSIESTSVKPILAPLWDDMYYDATTQIRYATLGSEPNRVFVVEWYNSLWYYDSGTAQQFQLHLYETTNVIKFSYNLQTPGGSPSASIGINDQTGGTGHYLSVTPGSPESGVSSTEPNNSVNSIEFLPTGKWYTFTYVPPAVGILSVNPDPIAFGNAYIGLGKTIPVSLSNVGGANLTVSTVSLTNNTVFTIPNPPSLPHVLTPGGAPLTFDMVYAPATTDGDADVLNISDDRSNTTYDVSGTGLILLTGEICEYPYLAPLPTVDYAGTTAGYANDYTSAMFTGLGSTSYVGGKDWVAKITVPADGWLDVSLADQTGYSSQWMGVFLVNTIPSLASPAAVLAQATGSSGPQTITDAVVAAGDYYVIVDNWPSPADIYFVLNISFEEFPAVLPPTGLTASNIDGDSADLGWTENNTPAALSWDIKYGAPGFDPGSEGTAVNAVSANPYTLTGLSPGTSYDWYVRSITGPVRDVSSWAGPGAFQTAQIPATLPLSEGWESGQGSWAIVNGTQTNAWYIGAGDVTYTPYEGSNFAYISNDGGASVAYTNTATSVVHLYRDIAFGADNLEFPLSFYWKCQGESSYYDYLQVFLVDTSVTPVAGTRLTTGQVGTNYNQLGTTWQQASITLPGTLSGSVKRLVFSWWNDSSVGTNPPINLDNISLTAVPIPSGPVLAPNLDYPDDRQDNLPIGGFPFQFSWNMGGTEPDVYTLYIANVADLPTYPYDVDEFWAAATYYEDVTSPYSPAFTYEYDATYVWTVTGYNAAYPDPVWQWPPYEFIIEPDPTIDEFCYHQDFEIWPPQGWDLTGGTYSFIQYTDGTGNNWAKANFWGQGSGNTDIMTTPPILSPDPLVFSFLWSHQYNATYPDDALTVEISTDYQNWTPIWYKGGTDLDSQDGAGSITPGTGVRERISISDAQYLGTPFWVRFYGYSGYGPDLFIDDVSICEALDYDIGPTAISGVPAVVKDGTEIAPVVTVTNFGLNTADMWFLNVSWGSLNSFLGPFMALNPGESINVSVPPFVASATTIDMFTATTSFAPLDEDNTNDVLATPLNCLPLNRPAVANDVWSNTYISFNLQNPGIQTALPTLPTYTVFMAGADWAENNWLGCEYDDGTLASDTFNDIDAISGATTYIGDMGLPIMGIAYNDNADVMYGTSATSLYTIETATGAATLVGAHNNVYEGVTGLMIDIAYDNANNLLYGIDLGLDCLWTIDTATGAATFVGWMGIDINFAQDAAFDQDNGLLYLAGYNYTTSAPGLYWIDTATGAAWLVGPMTSETTAFAIPYGSTAAAPDIAIAADGTISWTAVPNAVAYNIYAADDPYGEYVWIAQSPSPSWVDPNFPEAKKFYQITSWGGRAAGTSVLYHNTEMRKPRPARFTTPDPGKAPLYPVKNTK